MHTARLEIDSLAWGRNVLQITAFVPTDDFKLHESQYLDKYDPAYVFSAVNVADLERIEYLTHAGFTPVDCQLQLNVSFRRRFPTPAPHFTWCQVLTHTQLDEVLSIASDLDFCDRFSRDPLAPPGFSSLRYTEYLRQSFALPSDEIWCVCDATSGRILTFRSHRKVREQQVQLLLGGVRKELHGEGLGAISTHFCFNQMAAAGIKRGSTRISISNKPVFDLEVTHFGFRYHSASLILRKCYPQTHAGEQS
ncbi:MAG: hypothetical protein ACKO2P_05380 [Planctomycetota bacterium]